MSTDTLVTLNGPTMGTRWSARLASRHASPDLTAALQNAVDLVDRQMSTWRPDSDLMRLNRAVQGGWVDVGAELMEVLNVSAEVTAASDGAFDIGVGEAVSAWGFGAAQGQADEAAIRAAMGRRLRAQVECRPGAGRARRLNDRRLDLSGVAKGFAVDQMAKVLRGRQIPDFLANLDGEIIAHGRRPDGRPWAVALEEPDPGRRAARGVIEVTDCALATSGDYRHRIQLGAAWLSHTMDPRSGAPVRNRTASVTVLAADCARADAWATALMVLGETDGPALARAKGIEAIFLIREEVGFREEATLG
ncbi:MAG TPA: FAD:protein FMN transferase [Phenylobacterium sp.]|uniref:FAD:protein FMN transferase n=1 Tax=Phenylobacterium sp. TaxID=1871053 RepID=UPI002F92C710